MSVLITVGAKALLFLLHHHLIDSGTWFSGGSGSSGLILAHNDLRRLFNLSDSIKVSTRPAQSSQSHQDMAEPVTLTWKPPGRSLSGEEISD